MKTNVYFLLDADCLARLSFTVITQFCVLLPSLLQANLARAFDHLFNSIAFDSLVLQNMARFPGKKFLRGTFHFLRSFYLIFVANSNLQDVNKIWFVNY